MKNVLIALNFLILSCSSVFAEGLDIKLNNIKSQYSDNCVLYFDITNSTNLNITSGIMDVTFREADDTIISKDHLIFDRVKPKETIGAHELLLDSSCKGIKTIQLSFFNIGIDGDNLFN